MIRRFEENDLSAIMQIWLDANLQAHSFIDEAYWKGNFELVSTLLPQAEIYVYENEKTGEIEGFVGLAEDYIEGIFVKPGSQSKGIGSQLLSYVKNIKSRLTLSVYKMNQGAISFYQREQFSIQTENTEETTHQKEYVMVCTHNNRAYEKEKRKVRLFIAMSLDGFIADPNGGVGWLNGQSNDEETIDAYSEFIQDVDTVIMGWNTYHQIVTELSPDEWVYKGLTSYVITHHNETSSDQIRFVKESPAELVKTLKAQSGRDIWICGGASIIQQLVQKNLIDEYYLTIIPTLLGTGIRLFENANQEIPLRLVKTRSYNGMTDLIYRRRYNKMNDK